MTEAATWSEAMLTWVCLLLGLLIGYGLGWHRRGRNRRVRRKLGIPHHSTHRNGPEAAGKVTP